MLQASNSMGSCWLLCDGARELSREPLCSTAERLTHGQLAEVTGAEHTERSSHTFSGTRAVPRTLTFCGEAVAAPEANQVAQTRSPRLVTTSPSCTTACVFCRALFLVSFSDTPLCRSLYECRRVSMALAPDPSVLCSYLGMPAKQRGQ